MEKTNDFQTNKRLREIYYKTGFNKAIEEVEKMIENRHKFQKKTDGRTKILEYFINGLKKQLQELRLKERK